MGCQSSAGGQPANLDKKIGRLPGFTRPDRRSRSEPHRLWGAAPIQRADFPLERSSEGSVYLGLAGSQTLSIHQWKGDTESDSRLHVQLQSAVDIQLRSPRSHRRITDVNIATNSVRHIGARWAICPTCLSEE